MAYFPILEIVCRRWFPDEQSCAGRLLAGLGNMEDAEAGLDLWRLAVKVNDSPALKELIQSNAEWDIVHERLTKNSSGEEFLTDWNRFMKAHGHHCRGEIELYNRRWSETPDYILGLIRSYLGSMEKTNPLENHRRIAAEREQLAQELPSKTHQSCQAGCFQSSACSRSVWFGISREHQKRSHKTNSIYALDTARTWQKAGGRLFNSGQ